MYEKNRDICASHAISYRKSIAHCLNREAETKYIHTVLQQRHLLLATQSKLENEKDAKCFANSNT